jgi:hypothetical protein
MRQSTSFYPHCVPPPPPFTVLVHDDDNNVGVRPNSDAIVPRSRSPAATVIVAVNVIHSPSSQSCPSISSRSCGTVSRRRDDVTADRGRRRRRHLWEGVTTTTGGDRTLSSGWAADIIRRPSMPLSEIHRGADGMDRARHGRPPAAMATKTKIMTEETALCRLALTTCSPQKIPPNQAQGASPRSHR